MAEDLAAFADDQMQVDFIDEIEIDVVFGAILRDDAVRAVEAVPDSQKGMQGGLHWPREIAKTDFIDDPQERSVARDMEGALARTGTLDFGDVEKAAFGAHRIDSVDPARLGMIVDRFPDRLRTLLQRDALGADRGEGAAQQVGREIENELLLHKIEGV